MRFPEHWQQPESQATKPARFKAAVPAQPAICCLEHLHRRDKFTEERWQKREGDAFFFSLHRCWLTHISSAPAEFFRGFEDLGEAEEMWVIQHLWMNLPHLLPLSAVHVSIELETFPWRTDDTSKTCCSFHLEVSQWARFKKKHFSGPVLQQENLFPPHNKSYVGLCLKGVVFSSVQKEWLDVDSSAHIRPELMLLVHIMI